MAEAKQNQYEAMFLLGPNAAADQEAAINLCRQIIERHEGQVNVIKRWDERRLAYELGGQKRGTYIISFFKAPGKAVAAIERDVNLSEAVLRVLVLRADHLNQEEMQSVEPQPIVREERPSWEEGGRFSREGRGDRDRGDRGDRDRGDRGDRGGDRGDRDRRPRRSATEEAPASSAPAAPPAPAE